MAEYIDKTVALSIREPPKSNRYYQTDNLDDAYEQGWDEALSYIEKIPAADVAPVRHGRWIQVIVHVEFEDGFVDRVEEYCSACHEPNERRCTYFCHNCGAKMDLPDECKQDGER